MTDYERRFQNNVGVLIQILDRIRAAPRSDLERNMRDMETVIRNLPEVYRCLIWFKNTKGKV